MNNVSMCCSESTIISSINILEKCELCETGVRSMTAKKSSMRLIKDGGVARALTSMCTCCSVERLQAGSNADYKNRDTTAPDYCENSTNFEAVEK